MPVFGVSKGMLPLNISLKQSLFVSIEFHGHRKTVANLRRIWSPSFVGILPDLRQLCLSVFCGDAQRQFWFLSDIYEECQCDNNIVISVNIIVVMHNDSSGSCLISMSNVSVIIILLLVLILL